MNDKINRFTTQLGDNAPLAPDLESRTFASTSEVRGPSTGLRVGIALGVVAALGVGLVVANRDNSPNAVVPADELAAELSADGVATISQAVESALPDGYVVASVERPVQNSLNIAAASPDGVALLIRATLNNVPITDFTAPGTEVPIDTTAGDTALPLSTMAPGQVRHQTVLTNPGDTIQNIADALSVSVSQLAEQYGWSETYVFDSSVYVGWVDISTASDNCLIAPCVRYLDGDVVTIYSIAEEIGIPGQALAAYNGLALDQPVAAMFPIVLPSVEETMSMTGATVGQASDLTTPDSSTPIQVDINDSENLSVTIERFAFDNLPNDPNDTTVTQEIRDALLALSTLQYPLRSVFELIPLVEIIETSGPFPRVETLGELGEWYGKVQGSIAVAFTGPAENVVFAKTMMIQLPATGFADSVSTKDNGFILAIRSNEKTTCIVWLAEPQTIGATELEVAALADECLILNQTPTPETPDLVTVDTTDASSSDATAPPLTEAPVDTSPSDSSPDSTIQTP